MAASTLDTLAAADELRNAGFDERQARAIVALQNSAHTTLATKSDLATVKAELATEIDRSTTAMKAELAAATEPLATKAELAHVAEQVANLSGAFSMMKWAMGCITVMMLAMAGRLFGIV